MPVVALLCVERGEPEAVFLDHLIDMSRADQVCRTIRASCGLGPDDRVRLRQLQRRPSRTSPAAEVRGRTGRYSRRRRQSGHDARRDAAAGHAARQRALDLPSCTTRFAWTDSATSFISPPAADGRRQGQGVRGPRQSRAGGRRRLWRTSDLLLRRIALCVAVAAGARRECRTSPTVRKPLEFPKRHGFDISQLKRPARQAGGHARCRSSAT